MNFISKLLPNSARKWVLSGVGLLALIAFSGFIFAEATKAEVIITDNGEKQTITTNADTVEELLAEAGITYSKHDELSQDIDAAIEDGMTITYETAHKVTVLIDGNEKDYYTTADNIGEFLNENSISVSDHDDTSHERNAAISDGMKYTIDKAFQVTINDGDNEEEVWTTGGTVGELLKTNDISLDDEDELKPDKDSEVKEDNPITITRVEKVTDEVKETVDYQVEEREDSSLEKGKEKVIAQGQEGVLVKTFEITKENGEEVSRDLIDEEVEQESEKRIVALGKKENEPDSNLTTLSSESSNNTDNNSGNDTDNNNEGEKTMHMNATAYTVDCIGCNGNGYTATGINLRNNPNVVSVDPNVIPLGSKVWVEGYGEAIAGDTGGHIKGNRIDLHLESQSEAESFGRKTVEVRILD
ncbi:G5 and 3D domain-containing protein [Lentibacillus sp. CBA3610]|uniref:G5 and 3D domain-containing protein n=1 Tax=Lentibacillus sp. CBA3610 TaxID=2518176 RepID=UPI001595AF9E|nr:G5 and 3D domain-containing protein [Lentibacillus sp. CBA3610]QKY70883.1 DUF348 domain-containing protein [Lentibacillus sp. CBA3610]